MGHTNLEEKMMTKSCVNMDDMILTKRIPLSIIDLIAHLNNSDPYRSTEHNLDSGLFTCTDEKPLHLAATFNCRMEKPKICRCCR